MYKNLCLALLLCGVVILQGSCEDPPTSDPHSDFPTKLKFKWITSLYRDSLPCDPSQFYFSGDFITVATMDEFPDNRGLSILNRLSGKRHPNWKSDPHGIMVSSTTKFDDFDIGGINKEIAYLSDPWHVYAYDIPTGLRIWKYDNNDFVMDNRVSVIGSDLYQGYWPGDPFSYTWAKLARYNYLTGFKEDLFTMQTIQGYRFCIAPPVGYINNQNDTLLIGVSAYQNQMTYDCLIWAYCFNLRTRAMEWENRNFVVDKDYSDNLPVVIENGRVLIQTVSKISCLDILTGKLLWKIENLALSLNLTIPLYKHGKVYCRTDDGKLYCFDASNGSEIWSITTPLFEPITKSNFQYYNGKIYFNSYYQNKMALNCVSAETGEILWRDFGPNATMRGYLLLDENLGLLYGFFNGFVYCVDLNQTPVQ